MNFDSLSAEHDKRDFGLIEYECWKPMWQPFQSPETITFDDQETSVSFHNCTIKK